MARRWWLVAGRRWLKASAWPSSAWWRRDKASCCWGGRPELTWRWGRLKAHGGVLLAKDSKQVSDDIGFFNHKCRRDDRFVCGPSALSSRHGRRSRGQRETPSRIGGLRRGGRKTKNSTKIRMLNLSQQQCVECPSDVRLVGWISFGVIQVVIDHGIQ